MRSYGTSNRQVRLDDLEPLVHERRRVGGDDEPHVPGRMRERLLGRDIRQLIAGAPAERTAGCREHQPAHLAVLARAQRLRDRRVLGVDGDDLPGPRRRCHQLAADDERLLVGEREGGSGLEHRQGRARDRPSR